MSRGLSILIAAFSGIVLWSVPAWSVPDTISVLPSAQVDGAEIHLGDIARIRAQEFARELLGEIPLGRSPRPGKVKVFTKNQVLSGLRRHQDLLDGMVVEIPDRIYVKRRSQRITKEQIRLFVLECMEAQFKNREVSLDRLEIPESREYPLGHAGMAAPSVPRISSNGRFSMGLEIFVNGEKEDRIRISGHVAVYERVVAALDKMVRGRILSSRDGALVRKNIFSLKGVPVNRLDLLADMTLTRGVEKGQIILSQWLEPTPVVRKGDVVTLVAQRGGIMIRTMGVSREDGLKNSLIEVENVRSGKMVRGVVREPSTVEVVY